MAATSCEGSCLCPPAHRGTGWWSLRAFWTGHACSIPEHLCHHHTGCYQMKQHISWPETHQEGVEKVRNSHVISKVFVLKLIFSLGFCKLHRLAWRFWSSWLRLLNGWVDSSGHHAKYFKISRWSLRYSWGSVEPANCSWNQTSLILLENNTRGLTWYNGFIQLWTSFSIPLHSKTSRVFPTISPLNANEVFITKKKARGKWYKFFRCKTIRPLKILIQGQHTSEWRCKGDTLQRRQREDLPPAKLPWGGARESLCPERNDENWV